MMAWFVRLLAPSMSDVEWAILSGSRRAHRLATRYVRQNPNDSNGWFLLASVSLERQNYASVIEYADCMFKTATQPHERCSSAYLRILAHLRLGQPDEAARWVRLAADAPDLRKQMLGTPEIVNLPGASNVFDPSARSADVAYT